MESEVVSQLDTESHRPAWSLEIVPDSQRIYAGEKWQALQKQVGTESATNSWGWIDTWVKHFGSEVPHTYVFGNKNGQPAAAALLTHSFYTIRHGPFRMRTMFIGTAGEKKEESPHLSDHRLLVADEDRAAFAQSLMREISEMRWNQLLLQGIVPEDGDALSVAAKTGGVKLYLQQVPYPVFDLDKARSNYPSVEEALPQNKRRVRRSRKELEKHIGPLRGEWAETLPTAQDIYEELVRLNEERWTRIGHPGAFHTPRIRTYYFDLMNALFGEGKVSLYRYKAGDTTLGCIYSIHDSGNVAVGYKSGINFSDDVRRYAPGILTHVGYMGELWDRGFRQYDYGWGGDEYKEGISNAEDHLVFGFAYRGVRAHTLGITREIYSRYRDDPWVLGLKERVVKAGKKVSQTLRRGMR